MWHLKDPPETIWLFGGGQFWLYWSRVPPEKIFKLWIVLGKCLPRRARMIPGCDHTNKYYSIEKINLCIFNVYLDLLQNIIGSLDNY